MPKKIKVKTVINGNEKRFDCLRDLCKFYGYNYNSFKNWMYKNPEKIERMLKVDVKVIFED